MYIVLHYILVNPMLTLTIKGVILADTGQ